MVNYVIHKSRMLNGYIICIAQRLTEGVTQVDKGRLHTIPNKESSKTRMWDTSCAERRLRKSLSQVV